MPKYDVHIYAVVRVKVSGVEADNMPEAIESAVEQADIDELFPHRVYPWGVETEDAEEIVGYLVDVVGDGEHSMTTYYEQDGDGNYIRGGIDRAGE